MVVRFELENVGCAEASRFWFDGGAFVFLLYSRLVVVMVGFLADASRGWADSSTTRLPRACSSNSSSVQRAAPAAAASSSSSSSSNN